MNPCIFFKCCFCSSCYPALAVASRFEQLTAKNLDESYVNAGADKYRIFTSDTITSVDLSAVGDVRPEFNNDEYSILNLCASLEVGGVAVCHCPGFDFMYFALQGGVELQRIKSFLGNIDFPVIGYYARPPLHADHTDYYVFEHAIRATFMQWRMEVEQAVAARHINARHVLMFIKKFFEQVLHGRPERHLELVRQYQRLYAGCTTRPSERRASSVCVFVKHVPVCALMKLSCSDAEGFALSQRTLDKPWKSARFPDDVACKLLDGLTRLRMSDRYFDSIFAAYRAKESATGVQAAAILSFERELSGGAGLFSDAGVASGSPCSAFALFSECRAHEMVNGSEGDGTLGDQWDGLRLEVKEIYAEVARNIVVGEQLSDLKTRVEAKCTEQAAKGAPPQEEHQAEATALPLFLYLSDSL